LVLSVSACVERPQGGCVVAVIHSDVHGAEQYEVQGPGEWDANCIPGLNLCLIVFDQVPELRSDFTLRARRGNELSPPSEPFCVPGEGPVSPCPPIVSA
jgi:hypothetical protein